MGKAEKDLVKSPCTHVGDAGAIEAKVDAFVLRRRQRARPRTYPTPVLSKCSAGKKKCVGNLAKGLLGCINKAIGKNLSVDPLCVTKANDKYTGGIDATKGCFAKLEAKVPNDCLTTGDSADLQSKTAAFAADVASEEANPAACPALLDFTTGVGGGTCGDARNAANAVVKTLHCGGLNIGGGASTVGEGPSPDGSTNRFLLAGAGSCTIGATTAAPAVNSTQPDCTNTGCNFGAPLEIPNPSLPNLTTCVLNTFSAAASGTLDMATGQSATNTSLTSTTYLTGNLAQPCPRCRHDAGGTGAILSGSPSSPATGFCDRGPRATMACTTTNSIGLTRDCLTGGVGAPPKDCQPGVPGHDGCVDGTIVGPIAVDLGTPTTPLTTGTSTKTNATGTFCPGQGGTPGSNGCFNQPTCVTITETGSPGGPITPNVSAPAKLASVFCIAATANGLVNFAADLPGPGAIALVGNYNAHN